MPTQRNQTLADRALRGEPISDAEGLRRATESENSVYVYGDTLYVAGTKGPIWGNEWQQNFKYIAAPIFKGLIYNDIDKLQGLGTILAPEFATEMALARGAIELGKTQAGPGIEDATNVKVYNNARRSKFERRPKAKRSAGAKAAYELVCAKTNAPDCEIRCDKLHIRMEFNES